MMRDGVPGKGVCLFYPKGGLNPFRRHRLSDTDLNRVLAIPGVEELTYHTLSQAIVILYDRQLLNAERLCSCLKRVFPNPQYVHKELPLRALQHHGPIRRAMETFFEKLDGRFRERIDRCKDLALILPVGAAIRPVQLHWKRFIAPTWLEFIWQLIVL